MIGVEPNNFYVADEAQKMRDVLKLLYPFESGIITSQNLIERVWEYCFFNDTCVDPFYNRVMLTKAPLNLKVNREKMTEFMFEAFRVEGLYVALTPVLSVHST